MRIGFFLCAKLGENSTGAVPISLCPGVWILHTLAAEAKAAGDGRRSLPRTDFHPPLRVLLGERSLVRARVSRSGREFWVL